MQKKNDFQAVNAFLQNYYVFTRFFIHRSLRCKLCHELHPNSQIGTYLTTQMNSSAIDHAKQSTQHFQDVQKNTYN